jgi:hypothetical protein
MEINKVVTAVKVGDIVCRNEESPNLIKTLWINPKSELLRDNTGRVYFLVVNKIIYKIGGSQSKGGIKNTMSAYTDCMRGGPSDRSYIIHYLIYRELMKGNEVEVYMITSPKLMAPVTGLYGVENKEIAAFKEMELLCVNQHFESEKCYPEWNFQESHSQYPSDLAEQYGEFKLNRAKKNKK